MKIIYASEVDLSETGGHVTHIIEVVRALGRRGCQVKLVVPGIGRYSGGVPLDISYLPCIRYRFLALLSFEIILFFYLVVTRLGQGFDVLYVRSELYSFGATLHKLLFRVPLLVEVNSMKLDELGRRNKSNLLMKFVDKVQCFNFRRADKVICTAKVLVQYLAERYNLPHQKMEYVHNAANIQRFRPISKAHALEELGIRFERESTIVGFTGSLVEWQGLFYLVAVATILLQEFDNLIFVIVGDGPLREETEANVRNRGLWDSFMFIGRVPHDSVPMFINAFDICVIPRGPGVVGEPVKLYEYMSCGKPTVVPALESYRFVEQYGCGLTFQPGNEKSLAHSIRALLMKPAMREYLGKKGRELAEKKYNWDCVAERIHSIMSALIEDAPIQNSLHP